MSFFIFCLKDPEEIFYSNTVLHNLEDRFVPLESVLIFFSQIQ